MADQTNEAEHKMNDYSSTMLLCLLSSFGICVVVISILPVSHNVCEVIHAICRIISSGMMIVIACLVVKFTRKKSAYHKAQVVFWPMRCRHCALALGVQPQESGNAISGGLGCIPSTSSSLVDSTPSSSGQGNATGTSSSVQKRHSSANATAVKFSATSMQSFFVDKTPPNASSRNETSSQNQSGHEWVSNQYSRSLSSPIPFIVGAKRNRSLLNVFIIFCVFALISIPFSAIGKLMCVRESHDTLLYLVSGEIHNLVSLALIPVGMTFAVNYFDAVFVSTRQNTFTIVILLSGTIWLSVSKLIIPISILLESPLSTPGSPCYLNGTFGNFLKYEELILMPIYSECTIIATGILWQLWMSFVPKSVCDLQSNVPLIREFSRSIICSQLKKARMRCSLLFHKILKLCRRRGEECDYLLENETHTNLKRSLNKTWLFSAITSMIYFASCVYLVRNYDDSPLNNQHLYIAWCVEMVFILPFFIFFMQLSYVSSSSGSGRQGHVYYSWRRLEEHNIVLLLCTCGIFCLSIIRMIAAAGSLFNPEAVYDPNEIALFVFAMLYSVVTSSMIWLMTSFLLRIQRQPQGNIVETKWTLVCLIYMTLTNATQWLIESIIVQRWPVHRAYFGNTAGQVIGILLDPFVTLYGLHAAMVAYEIYKTTVEKACDRLKSLELYNYHLDSRIRSDSSYKTFDNFNNLVELKS